jgi:hypothetical protein
VRKPSLLILTASVAGAVLAAATLWSARPAAPAAPAAPAQPTPDDPAPENSPPYYRLGDKMELLQRWTVRLSHALDAGNATLASVCVFQMQAIADELVSLGVIHQGRRIGYLSSLQLQPPLAYLDAALERSDLKTAKEDLFPRLLLNCNTCHAATGVTDALVLPPEPLSDTLHLPAIDVTVGRKR